MYTKIVWTVRCIRKLDCWTFGLLIHFQIVKPSCYYFTALKLILNWGGV